MDTLKTGDKRLISFAVDLGTRVTTNFDSGAETVRSVTARRGVLISRTAVEITTTYTIENVDAAEKTLMIEHPVTPGQKVLKPKPDETAPNHYRFAVKLAARGTAKLPVVEEREIENTISIISLTPDVLATYIQARSISPAGRKQLEAIAAKKGEIAAAERDARQAETEANEITRDQDRLRQNLSALNRVTGQQAQVQRYADELAAGDAKLAQLRDRLAAARKRQTALQNELNALIEKLEF
jgi:hypothetical protein